MKEDKHLDQVFRHKLRHHASPTPDHLWEEVERRRTPGYIFMNKVRLRWSALGLLLLIGTIAGTGIYFSTQNNNVSLSLNASELSQHQLASAFANTAELNTTTSTTNTNKNSTTLETGLLNKSNQQVEQSNKNNKNKAVATAVASSENDATIVKTTNDDHTNEATTSNNQSDFTKTNVAQYQKTENLQQAIDLNSEVANQNHVATEHTFSASSDLLSSPALIPTKTAASNDNSENQLDEKQVETTEEAVQISETKAPLAEFEAIEIREISVLNFLDKTSKIEEKTAASLGVKGCPVFKESPIRVFADIFVAPQYDFKTLSAKDPENNNYATERNDSESYFYSYSSGVRFSWVTRNNIAFRFGLAYTQMNERFKFQREETLITQHLVPIDTIYTAPGTAEIVYEQVTRTEVGTREIDYTNRYRMFDIPIMLGYELDLDPVMLNINAGTYFNLLFTQKATFFSPDLEPFNYSTEQITNHEIFKDRLGFSLYGSLGINYKINSNVQLLFEPHVRYYLNSFTDKNYELDQRYITGGLLSGIRYQF